MKVLLILEDPTLDAYIAKPIIERIFADIGRAARIEGLTDPYLSGAHQALDPGRITAIIEDHRMTDPFLLVVDRDCDRMGHETKAASREREHPNTLIAALACQEIEVWALALHRDQLRAAWTTVRAECDPKETSWDPLVRKEGWIAAVGKGRKKAMRELGKGWSGLLQVCPEIATLRDRVRTHLEAHGSA